jgi:hypothetical protein
MRRAQSRRAQRALEREMFGPSPLAPRHRPRAPRAPLAYPEGIPGGCWACGNVCSPASDPWTCPACGVVYPVVTEDADEE